jgi:DUF971 family protein
MDPRYAPKSVDVSNSEQCLTIVWKDGKVSEYPLFGLRKNCPCVACRGGHDQMGRFEPELFRVKPARVYNILKAEPVGNHALKITWDDGHNAGMYRWDLLRQMGDMI